MKEQQILSPKEDQIPVAVHMSQMELDYFDQIQGGAEDKFDLGLRSFYKLWRILQGNEQLRNELEGALAVYREQSPPQEEDSVKYLDKQNTKAHPHMAEESNIPMPGEDNPEVAKLASEGEQGDDEIVIMPYGLTQYLDQLLGGERVNPKTGLKQYFKLGKFFKKILRPIRPILPVVGAVLGSVIGAPFLGSALGIGSTAASVAGSAIGAGLGTAIGGGGGKDILKSSAFGGLGSYALQAIPAFSKAIPGFSKAAGSTWGGSSLPAAAAAANPGMLQQASTLPATAANPGWLDKISGFTGKIMDSKLPMAAWMGSLLMAHHDDKKMAKSIMRQHQENEKEELQHQEKLEKFYGVDQEVTPNKTLRSFARTYDPSSQRFVRDKYSRGGEVRNHLAQGGRGTLLTPQLYLYYIQNHKPLPPISMKNHKPLPPISPVSPQAFLEVVAPVTTEDISSIPPLLKSFKQNHNLNADYKFDPNGPPPLLKSFKQNHNLNADYKFDPNGPPPLLKSFKRAQGGSSKTRSITELHLPYRDARVELIKGRGKGQDDVINRDLKEGDYIIDASTVSDFGDGSSKAGYLVLKKLENLNTNPKFTKYEGLVSDHIIPAALSNDEVLIEAPIVNMLGKGSNARGAKVLKQMVHKMRKHKNSKGLELPPKAKRLSHYIEELRSR